MNLFEQEPQPAQQSYREIPLTQGQVAIVDARAFAWLSQWNWYASWKEECRTFYAQRISGRTRGKSRNVVLMHRFILNAPKGSIVDHKDHNGLHNWAANIRFATNGQNAMNARLRSDNTSGYKGVIWSASRQKWIARLQFDGKQIHLGYHDDPKIAYAAYCRGAAELFGEFANPVSKFSR